MLKSIALPPSLLTDRLHDARTLEARIAGLRSLLDVQRRQIEALSEKLEPTTPAGRAASRLLDLKDRRLQQR